jgi:hypothetical protein
VAVLGKGAGGLRLALLLLGWSSDAVLCTNGPAELSPEQK